MVLDHLRNAGRFSGEGLNLLWRGIGRPARGLARLRSRAPERLLISPQDIRTADPTVAADIYAGYFAFAGKMANTHGKSPFEIEPASPAWAAALAGFGWLRHLRAADTALARANARALVEDWLALSPRNPALPAREPRVAARRLMSWLSQSPMILDGADRDFYQRFMKAIGRLVAFLQGARGDGARGEDRLFVAIALAEAGICTAGMGGLQRRSTQLLATELTRQILADGGHAGRNPQTLLDLLLDLLPLRQAYAHRGVAPPGELLNAIDRMLPMLRLLRLGDGSLALFNGMGATQPDVIATVLAHGDARAAAPVNAPYSGYQRLEAGGSVLVMDTGAPPPWEFSGRAHAGQLSFELSVDGQRLVGNCGAPDETRAALREAARATAAHSTLVVADTSSSRFAPASGLSKCLGGRVIAGVRRTTMERSDGATGHVVAASHDGYVARFGLVHERTLQLSGDGGRLAGWDRLIASGKPPKGVASPDFTLRFHLHPAIIARKSEDSLSVSLQTPDGAAWFFHAGGYPLELEPGIYFAVPDGARRASQIVINANAGHTPGVDWVFERAGAA